MARILPDTPPRLGSSEVVRVFNALKKLPDEYSIWHNMNFLKQKAPDFLVLHKSGCALLIVVSSATARDAKIAGQFTLLPSEEVSLGTPEEETLSCFMASLDFPVAANIQRLVVFPNISHEQLQKASTQPFPAHWVGKEVIQPDTAIHWDRFLSAAPLDELTIEKLRQRFTPEVVVRADMTVRPPMERRLKAGLTDYLLDYDQELAVKSDLDLSVEGQTVSNDVRLNIINGVAGSGKTLILLYRLRLLHRNFPDKRFLVLTHNRPLSFDI